MNLPTVSMFENRLAALEGDRDGAVRGFSAADRLYRQIGITFEAAQCGLTCLTALGSDVAEARSMAEAAQADFARVGAAPYVERIEALMAMRTASSTRTVATSTSVPS